MINRYKRTNKGYIFDRLIFKIACWTILIFLFAVCWLQGFNFKPQLYIKCDSETQCLNPFYDPFSPGCNYEWCSQKYLDPGFEFGKKPHFLFISAPYITICMLAIAFGVNHYKYNRKWGGM